MAAVFLSLHFHPFSSHRHRLSFGCCCCCDHSCGKGKFDRKLNGRRDGTEWQLYTIKGSAGGRTRAADCTNYDYYYCPY